MRLFKRYPIIVSAVAGLLLLLPIIILEMVNRARFNENFPFSLYIFAWVLQTIFILILTHIRIKRFRSLTFFLQITVLLLVAFIWGGWLIDQLPCLMGIPNCD